MAIYDVTGEGSAIVFLHAAIGDRRMWRPQWGHFEPDHRLLRIDLRGFGEHAPSPDPYSHVDDVLAVMDAVEIDRAVIVGGSMGGRVALQAAVEAPERVTGLMLFGSAGIRIDWSTAVQTHWTQEAEALETGNLERAVELNLDFWIDGPRRSRSRLSPADRDLVADMQRVAFEHDIAHPNAAKERPLTDLGDRLGEISVPTTVAYGTEDATDIARIAEEIAERIPDASLSKIYDTAHLPSVEAPDESNALLADLIARCA